MKNSVLLFSCYLIFLLSYSCGQISQKENQAFAQKTFEHNGQIYVLKKNIISDQIKKPIKPEQSKVIFHEVKDTQRNMLLGYMPLPENWKIHASVGQDQVIISGPDDIKVYAPQSNYFTYSELPGMNQMSSQAGQQVKPLMSVENLVKEILEPAMRQDGAKLINQYHLPELQKYAENYDQFTFKSVPMRKEFKAYATEWESDKENSKLLIIINYFVSYSQTGIFWGYYANMIEAPRGSFEVAKKNYLYALSNSKYNPKWLQTCYIEEAKKARQRGEIHEQRMYALRAEGQAIIQRGKEHSAMVDANHKNWMDGHLGRTNVTSQSTSQSFQVDAGSNEYWMNSSNEYISSDDLFYDPNNDNSVNNESWTKMTIQK